jgi:hypothetical protein
VSGAGKFVARGRVVGEGRVFVTAEAGVNQAPDALGARHPRGRAPLARRGPVVARSVNVLGRADGAVKRPGTGIEPGELDRVLGRRLARPVRADELLDWSMLAS